VPAEFGPDQPDKLRSGPLAGRRQALSATGMLP